MNEDTYIYSERQVAELLPTLWCEVAKLNPSVKASDPEMPKGPAPDPSHSGDHMAHCADISRAWERAFLTLAQKQALLLRYGLNWTQAEVGTHFDITQQAAAYRESSGIKNICTFLNGKREDDNSDE